MPNPTSLYVQRRISTGEILKRSVPYPRADGGPIIGLDPDLEYLEMVSDVEPDYDPRYFILNKIEDKLDETWKTSFSTTKRVIPEIKLSVKNKETFELQKQVPFDEQMKLIMLGLGVIFRASKGLTLTTKEQAVADKIVSISTALWKNDARRKQIESLIDIGQEPDIDTGWELQA